MVWGAEGRSPWKGDCRTDGKVGPGMGDGLGERAKCASESWWV